MRAHWFYEILIILIHRDHALAVQGINLRFNLSKKSSGLQKSYVLAVFYHKALPKVIRHFESLWHIDGANMNGC